MPDPMSAKEPPTFFLDKRFLLLSLLLVIVAIGFWGGSRYPALNQKALMGAETELSALGFDTLVVASPDDGQPKQILYNTINWAYTNKVGMLFGLLLAALLMTLLPLLGQRALRGRLVNTLTGMVIGTPLGVCVNCAAPIAMGLRSAGARAETALAAMLSSPTLNVIVLTMLFALFPTYLAVIKLCLTLGFILLAIPLLTRFVPLSSTAGFGKEQTELSDSAIALPWMNAACEIAPPREWSQALRWVGQNFARNLWFIVITTVPLMILAGFLGSALITLLPFDSLVEILPKQGGLWAIASMGLVGLIGTFLPVPMAFDVIVVAILLQAGLPVKYAAILLFTLGIFSVYSFSIVWQSISKWVAIVLFGLVAAVGLVAGASGHYADLWQRARDRQILLAWTSDQLIASVGPHRPESATVVYQQAEDTLVASLIDQALIPAAVLEQDGVSAVSVARLPFQPRTGPAGGTDTANTQPWFERIDGRVIGLDEVSPFSMLDLVGTYGQFRGIAAGDIHQDGWTDVLLTTSNGLALYANRQGQSFVRQEITGSALSRMYVVNAALVDLNNDGWLDIYFSTYREGNYALYNQAGRFSEETLRSIPNYPEAILTAATTFGDVDQDGDLDIALGNWSIGEMTTNPRSFPTAANAWLRSQAGDYSLHPLEGVDGETLSILFTDFNQDGALDLLIGNDFDPADIYYLGNGEGGFRKLTPADEMIPHSPRWTMSFTTADVNNDLTPEIYAAQISAGPAKVISNEQICAEYEDGEWQQQCIQMREITDAVKKSRKQNDVTACAVLNPDQRDGCMAYYMLMEAVYRQKDPTYCKALPAAWEEFAFLCNYHFDIPSTPVNLNLIEEILSVTDPNVLLMREGTGPFVDKAEAMGLTIGGWGWNAKFADIDLDGWQDIYLVSGYIGPIGPDGDFSSNYFFQNRAGQTFIDQTDHSGLSSNLETLSYTYIDLDNDGDLDILSVPMFGPVWVYKNQTVQGNGITFTLRDRIGNRFGIGSKIIIHYGNDQHQMREIQAGGGYLSYDAPIAHFGLGDTQQVERVEIIWSTGERSELSGLASGSKYIITRNK